MDATGARSASAGRVRWMVRSGISGHLVSGLVVAQPEVAGMAEAVVMGPLPELELGHQLRSHPARAPQDLGPRRRGIEGTVVRRELGQQAPEARELRVLEAGAHAAREAKRPAVARRVVMAHEQRAETTGSVAL